MSASKISVFGDPCVIVFRIASSPQYLEEDTVNISTKHRSILSLLAGCPRRSRHREIHRSRKEVEEGEEEDHPALPKRTGYRHFVKVIDLGKHLDLINRERSPYIFQIRSAARGGIKEELVFVRR